MSSAAAISETRSHPLTYISSTAVTREYGFSFHNVVGDLLATKKATGFSQHNSTQFCSWCLAKSVDLDTLEHGAPRTQKKALKYSKIKECRTKNAQDTLLRANSVKWHPPNTLPISGDSISPISLKWQKENLMYPLDSIPEYSDGTDNEDDNIFLDAGPMGSLFSEDGIEQFFSSMKDVILPSGLSKLPPNLAKEKHGQLSAVQWYILFAYVVPLVIFDFCVDKLSKLEKESNHCKFSYSAGYLVQCTHIVCSRNLSKCSIKRFEINYKHRLSIRDLFPEAKVVPNHHFALNIPEQLRKWGPLAGICKFPGEHLICCLHKIHTNHQIETSVSNGEEAYDVLLRFVRRTDPKAEHKDTIPVPRGEMLLSGYATPVKSIVCSTDLRVPVVQSNNFLLWRDNQNQICYGLVQQLYEFKDHLGQKKSVIVISPIINLPKETPFKQHDSNTCYISIKEF
ncbi:hypothetical protein VP01_1095g5 [Puccinia sorghi]|uniref:Uncharacterized protein n=1 Tax=Puccinia sorghi TaxID=27349 RepID=A0A0L6VT11_9BASI|nr:hypothetical protein VP01_1095g5 [Puccinia sorghi]